MAKQPMRVCSWCDKETVKVKVIVKGEEQEREKTIPTINLTIDKYVVEVLKSSKKHFHYDCYIEYLIQKKKLTEEEAKIKAKKLLEEHETESLSKDKFFYYIYDKYNTTALSPYVFKRVDEIICGVYKGLIEPITYEDLLIMFQKQAKTLDNIAIQKERKGEGFKDVNQRLLFDLAVIVGKYDSYKKWKQQQNIRKSQINKETTDIELIKAQQKVIENNSKRKELLNDIPLDELF